MVDCVNKDDNDVTAGDITTACQPAEQKRPGRPICLGRTKKRGGWGGDWCIHLAFSLILSLFLIFKFFLWVFVRRETFWFVLPTLYLCYSLEWKRSVTSGRISGDLAPYSKSKLFKVHCSQRDAGSQPLSSLSSFSSPSVSILSICIFPLPHPCFPLCLPTSLSVLLQDSERKGFMNKLYAIQDVCISVQNALDEVASYGERIKKWVESLLPGIGPTSLCFAPHVLVLFPHCRASLPSRARLTYYT